MKKICIAIHGLAHAGAERVAASWANYLAEQGKDVIVLMYAVSENSYDLDERIRVIPLAETAEVYYSLPKVQQLLRIRRVIRVEKPDQIISFLPKMQISMMVATFGMKIKRIETVRNNPWVDRDIDKKRFLWNLCFRRSDAIIVQTWEQALYFPDKLRKKCVVISNPVSKAFAAYRKTYQAGTLTRFVAVARLNAQKNYPMMIRAFSRIMDKNPGCALDIYGKGSPEVVEKLQSQIDRLGMHDHIRLRGWIRNIPETLLDYDAFLLSSDYEGMPNALAEAMAVGLICLSTDCRTGPKDMIDHGVSGFLAATGDESSFVAGIEAILQMNLEERTAMGAAAREKILTMCSEENTLRRLNELIESDM